MKYLVKELLEKAISDLGFERPQSYKIELPPRPEFGDYATNISMSLVPSTNKSPQEIAELICSKLNDYSEIEKVEIAGPGFINIFLKSDLYYKEILEVLKQGKNYGRLDIGKKEKIQVEYISANPTGPLHIGNARGGPIGQALVNLFAFIGYDASSEFYINDIGGQVDRFAETLYYWFAVKEDSRIEFPEGGYPGEYMKDISEKIQLEKKDELARLKNKDEIVELFKKEGLYYTVKSIREDAQLLGISFDNWVNQSDFEVSGKTDSVITKLIDGGMTTKKEGALWFKSPNDPELSDRECVLRKSDEKGTFTYFADDIAYHADKFDRGFTRIIDVWGANHSGHVPRLKAAMNALGYAGENLEIILYQYVRLKNAGKVVSMGKRLGNFVTIPQILESGVAPDAFKYFILSQNPNTPFDFDLALAADTSEKNPVFYIKYAHARIASILRKAGDTASKGIDEVQLSLLNDPREQALYREITRFPDVLLDISENFQIQTLPHYVYKISSLFHDFYAHCQVLSGDKALTQSRLCLIMATQQVIYNALAICGIDAPDKM